MTLLSSVGQIYMFVLLVLLFLGSGFALWSFINFIMEKKSQNTIKKNILNQEDQGVKLSKNSDFRVLEDENSKFKNKNLYRNGKIQEIIGGLNMNNNGWLKLAVFSFVGVLASIIILGLVSTNNRNGNYYQQQGNMNMQGGTNPDTNMSNTNMQNGSNGNNVQHQLNQIQQQLNQLQQQLNGGNSNNNAQMQQNGSSNSGGMGMSNMPQNSNMNNMPQNNSNMNNMPQNNGSNSGASGSSGSSGSGMSMM